MPNFLVSTPKTALAKPRRNTPTVVSEQRQALAPVAVSDGVGLLAMFALVPVYAGVACWRGEVGMCTLSANCRGHVKRKREAQITGGGVDVLKYMSIIQ